ncbi:MAG: hypothetical protein KCHDKBKB_02816 [Elusimicrobia bacterium]|nr:hypothetical protein [Elusimicrobiota bacterium]
MEASYRHIDPEKMTSQERLDRIVEILVQGGLRLAEEEKALEKQRLAQPMENVRPSLEILL